MNIKKIINNYKLSNNKFKNTEKLYIDILKEWKNFHNLIMVIDCETTGFPECPRYNVYYDYTDINKYETSRIVQISWALYDHSKLVKIQDYIIKPNGFTVKKTEFHGITDKIAKEKGNDIKLVFNKLLSDLKRTSLIVGHNILFDENIVI